MTASEKLNALLTYFGTNKNKLGTLINKRQNLYDIDKGKIKSFSPELVTAIKTVYPSINDDWFIFDKGSMILGKQSNDDFLSHLSEPEVRINPTTKDISKEIEKAKKSKTNGKQHNSNDGQILSSGDTVEIKTFVIPMKGFSGLKNAIYDDQYITEHFEQTTTEVPHHLYSPVSYRIQSSGKSMPISIPNNAWVTGVPVPEMSWLEYKFNPEKIYILFHPYRGILFKKVRNLKDGEIMLCSENSDKDEYPDEVFKIIEFRKILLAIKVELFI